MSTISHLLLTAILTLISSASALTQKNDYFVSCIAFYNVENLFDTIDDPIIKDDEYTPEGRRKWNKEKYQAKISNVAYVLSQLGLDKTKTGASIIGLCEIENRKVLEDLVAHKFLKNRNYQIIHKDSPDQRGIDVAFLYQADYFKVIANKSHTLHLLQDDTYYPTRDILHVEGLLEGEKIHFLVNHWPSRRGGTRRSSPNRKQAASTNRTIIDSLMLIDASAKIILMGDLNDNPDNRSVQSTLGANATTANTDQRGLYNPMHKIYTSGVGSNAYRDEWQLFDQMIISHALLDKNQDGYFYYRSKVFKEPFLIQKSGHFKGYPFRTFSGSDYQGGYSDHLPVLTYLLKAI